MDSASVSDPIREPRTYLVERYWPDIDESRARSLAVSLDRTARAMVAEEIAVEHMGSILMPDDQVVFSLIAATDEASARELASRVGAPADRIAQAIRLTEEDRCNIG